MDDDGHLPILIPFDADGQRWNPMDNAAALAILGASEKGMIMGPADMWTRRGMRAACRPHGRPGFGIELPDGFCHPFPNIPDFGLFGRIHSPACTHAFTGMPDGREITVVAAEINHQLDHGGKILPDLFGRDFDRDLFIGSDL